MTFSTFYQWANFLALMAATSVALWRGGRPERIAATVMILAWIASALGQNAHVVLGPQAIITAIDTLLFLVLLAIALTSDRWWPLWACAFQGLTVVLALAMAADPRVWSRSGFIAGGVFSYLTMLALFLGAMGRPSRPAPDAASPLT